MSPKPLQIGVMLEAVQLSDIMGIDILGSCSKAYITASLAFGAIPATFADLAPDITFHYISSSLEPSFVTPSLRFLPTHTYDSCPRDLDILLVGGPLPDHRPAAADKFLKEAAEKTEVIMSVCTGGMWLADAGVLEGKKATANRGVLEILRKTHPEVEWKDERWVVDGKFWTAGGAGCGVDMVVEYVKQVLDERVVAYALEALQLGSGKGRFYE
jgi:transcriptional regulator GlxA family with amidase domain